MATWLFLEKPDTFFKKMKLPESLCKLKTRSRPICRGARSQHLETVILWSIISSGQVGLEMLKFAECKYLSPPSFSLFYRKFDRLDKNFLFMWCESIIDFAQACIDLRRNPSFIARQVALMFSSIDDT